MDTLCILLPLLGVTSFLSMLSRRLRGPHPAAKPQVPLSPEQLSKVSYEGVDMLKGIPRQATHAGYAIIGGSGFLGTYVVRLLLLRGETNIRILDINPPSMTISSDTSVTYIRTDITSLQSVRDGLTRPFSATGSPPDVIYLTAALIRFWERASYCWPASKHMNVDGIDHVLQVAKELPSAILIYTSTADTAIPRPKFMRLGLDYRSPPYNAVVVSDFDEPLSPSQSSASCYSRSKLLAEQLVINANRKQLKTGIIRPGYTIIGPNDRLLTSTLTMPRVPVWDKMWSSTNICVWDAAAAHLMYEDALRRIPDSTSGQAFLVSGNGPAWRLQDTRNAVKHYSTRPIILDEVSPLLIYLIAHIVEVVLFVRYYFLVPFCLLVHSKPALNPKWMGRLVYLQPSTFEYMSDIVIDDSRARKALGYRPQWDTAQCIKYTVDEIQSGKTGRSHGLELKSS